MIITRLCLLALAALAAGSALRIENGLLDGQDDTDYVRLGVTHVSGGVENGNIVSVYAKTAIAPDDIICEMRGHLLPEKSLSPSLASGALASILTFGVVSNAHIKYRLIENSICSKIKFCFTSGSDGASCEQNANAVVIRARNGKICAVSLGITEPGTELLLEIRENRSVCNVLHNSKHQYNIICISCVWILIAIGYY
jgi:hypothetical protein